jgi:hypothetical protein
VPAFLTHRERTCNPSQGKSDPSAAVAMARVAARGEGLSSPQRSDVFVDLELLSDHRDQLVRARTRLINRTHTELVISHPGYEKRIVRGFPARGPGDYACPWPPSSTRRRTRPQP